MAREIAAGLTNDESSRGAIGAPLILREHVVRRIPLFNNMRRNIRTALDTALDGTRRWEWRVMSWSNQLAPGIRPNLR
jgi:hypothetical protein